MPFVPFRPSIHAGSRRLRGAVRIVRIKGYHGRLSIAADLFEALGKPTHFRFMIGTGPDAGRVMLVPAPDGYVVIKRAPSCTAMAVTIPAGIGAKAPPRTTVVAHELTTDGLIVDLSPFIARGPAAAAAPFLRAV